MPLLQTSSHGERGRFPPPFPQAPIPLPCREGDDGCHPPWHQPCRAPSHDRASPSLIKASPSELPARNTVRSLRPYLSSSRNPAASENFPALSSVSRRDFAASPFIRSASQRGGLSSGVSISAMRIFWPSNQKVSPSTTQFARWLPSQIENAADNESVVGVSWPKWRNRGERRRRHRQANLQKQ